jgi:L-fuconolactonase
VTHLGLPPDGDPTWSALPELLSLAVYPNVAVKATGVPVHSAEGYPFPDVWLPLHRVIDRFGIDRIMWGTDWTRITAFGYSDGVRYITETSELSLKEKEAILGKNLKTIMQWNRGTPKRNEKPKQSDR